MSGIEIAGLVLGAFPIILKCLENYREGLEPLDNWWNFRTDFIAFVDDIKHQMMKYNENMVRLLDPIISDDNSLTALVRNAKDPRWHDGSLDVPLEQRLAGEHKRVLRIIERMDKVVNGLKKLLRIEGTNLRWIGSDEERPWEWHWMRIRLSLSKGKTKLVKKLAAHNLELEEILGYSERINPVAEARSLTKPIALFDKIRHLACIVHNALESHWKCHSRKCRKHQALLTLRSEIETVDLSAIFITEAEQASIQKSLKQEVMICLADAHFTTDNVSLPINYAQQSFQLAALQEGIETSLGKQKGPTSSNRVQQTPISGSAAVTTKKKAHFDQSALAGTTNRSSSATSGSVSGTSINHSHIIDLCSSLRKSSNASLGIMMDQHNRQIQLTRCAKPDHFTTAPDTVGLRPLSQILHDHHKAIIDIPRQRRFAMARHVACALLQIQMSPWLSHEWSKDEFQFLCDNQTVHSDNPHVSQVFFSNTTLTSGQGTCRPPATAVVITEDETRASLFKIGVVILELLFGHNIEDCDFRRQYYGPNNQPNEWTDLCTARKWATKVLGECGVEIADVVRRCLDCSFGPRPNLQDKRFREAVYEGVIRPLADYSKIWRVAQP